MIHEKLAKSNGPEISLWHFHGSCLKRARSLSRVTKTLASPDIKRLLRSWLATRIYKTREKRKNNGEQRREYGKTLIVLSFSLTARRLRRNYRVLYFVFNETNLFGMFASSKISTSILLSFFTYIHVYTRILSFLFHSYFRRIRSRDRTTSNKGWIKFYN